MWLVTEKEEERQISCWGCSLTFIWSPPILVQERVRISKGLLTESRGWIADNTQERDRERVLKISSNQPGTMSRSEPSPGFVWNKRKQSQVKTLQVRGNSSNNEVNQPKNENEAGTKVQEKDLSRWLESFFRLSLQESLCFGMWYF